MKLLECKLTFFNFNCNQFLSNSFFLNSIYTVHDDAKDKEFELELSWITNETKRHEFVPKDIAEEAERLAKVFIIYYLFAYLHSILIMD